MKGVYNLDGNCPLGAAHTSLPNLLDVQSEEVASTVV
jgi:hypothetical protein